MTGDQAKARVRAIANHYGIKEGEPVDTMRWAELAIAYDEIDPLTEEDAETFSAILIQAFKSMEQKLA